MRCPDEDELPLRLHAPTLVRRVCLCAAVGAVALLPLTIWLVLSKRDAVSATLLVMNGFFTWMFVGGAMRIPKSVNALREGIEFVYSKSRKTVPWSDITVRKYLDRRSSNAGTSATWMIALDCSDTVMNLAFPVGSEAEVLGLFNRLTALKHASANQKEKP